MKYHTKQSIKKWSLGIFVTIFIISLPTSCSVMMGTHGFGPIRTQEIVVNRLYVDSGGKSDSHYMVASNKGVFEVTNGVFWGYGNIWNADEIYGKLKENQKYIVTIKGNRQVGWFFQQYPYIVDVQRK